MAAVEYDIIDEINMISLSRLMDGGAAMLDAANMNHHNDIIGTADIIPLVRKMLRVCVISYLKLAKINRADDVRP